MWQTWQLCDDGGPSQLHGYKGNRGKCPVLCVTLRSSFPRDSYQAGSKHRWYQQAKLYSSPLQLRLWAVTLSICWRLGRLPNPVAKGLLSSVCLFIVCVCVCVLVCVCVCVRPVSTLLVGNVCTAPLLNIVTLICKHSHPSGAGPPLIQTDEEGVCSYNLLSSRRERERIIIISPWCTVAPSSSFSFFSPLSFSPLSLFIACG